MALNNKIKNIRQKTGLTQEAFSEKILVSRQAVTKWESGKGIPDIENLKMISNIFNISLDELLNEKDEINPAIASCDNSEVQRNCLSIVSDDNFENYIGTKCSIELSGWNDGAFHVTLLSKDQHFLFYIYTSKKETKIGAIAQRFVKSIEDSKSQHKASTDYSKYYGIDETFFIGKALNLNLHEQHIWNGLIGKETEYNDIILKSVSDKEFKILVGKFVEQTIPRDEISKFEYTVE